MPFKENEIVLYTDIEGRVFQAEITKIDIDLTFHLTFLDTSYSLIYGRNSNRYSSIFWDRVSSLTPKDKSVENRIKKLWNNSNWVRNNPAQAY